MALITSLQSDHKNARRRTDRSSELIKESLQRYGAARSIVIDEDNRILAGNGTIEGAKAAGISKVRIIETDGDEIIAVKRTGLTEEQKVGLALADNRTADLSEWDQEMLHQLSEEHDLTPWFNQEDLDELLSVTNLEPEEGNTDPDDVPETPEDPITKPGDLWILGNHRLLCGDSTNPQHVERLMDGKKADMVFTDPPFPNNSKIMHEMLVGIEDAFDNACLHCDGLMLWFWDNLSFPPFKQKVTAKHVWHKTNGWQAGHFETIYGFHQDDKRHEQLVFSANSVGGQNTRQIQGNHPTPKPIELLEEIFNTFDFGVKILDMFGGSGSTLIACEKTSRHCRMMELDPAYVDVIVKRWEDFTGNTAVCEPSAAHFEQELDI
jgi:16S rRNA G966 N2-methylase RsmD